MFKLAMAALIKGMGVEDKDVEAVYQKFMELHQTGTIESPGQIVSDMREAIDSL